MYSRRDFLIAVPASVLAAPSTFAFATNPTIKIGCQTNAWRIDPKDFNQVLAVLARLKELGFEGFETGFRNIQGQFENVDDARSKIQKTGLQFFGAHIFLEKYDPQTHIPPLELISAVAQGAAKLGAQRVIVSGANLSELGDRKSAIRAKASALNTAGRACKVHGLCLAYHNHAPEFTKTAAENLEIEDLIRDTDATSVDFIIDCGWAFRAKTDLPAFFTRYQKRIVGLHLRDFKGDEQVPLGQGDFPIKALADAINRSKWSGWALNEEERLSGEKPGEKAVGPARGTLRTAFGK